MLSERSQLNIYIDEHILYNNFIKSFWEAVFW